MPHLKIRAESQKIESAGSFGLPCLEPSRVALGQERDVGRGRGSACEDGRKMQQHWTGPCGLLVTSGKQGWCIMLWSLQMEKDQSSTDCYFYPRPQSAIAAPDAASGGIIHPASTCRSLWYL